MYAEHVFGLLRNGAAVFQSAISALPRNRACAFRGWSVVFPAMNGGSAIHIAEGTQTTYMAVCTVSPFKPAATISRVLSAHNTISDQRARGELLACVQATLCFEKLRYMYCSGLYPTRRQGTIGRRLTGKLDALNTHERIIIQLGSAQAFQDLCIPPGLCRFKVDNANLQSLEFDGAIQLHVYREQCVPRWA